jgi:serine/threonine-protein kinase
VKQPEISSLTPPPAEPSTGEFPPEAGPGEGEERETVFGRYRLLRRIGRGGMAEAFLAVMEGAKGFRRKCVVKRIRPDKARSTYFTQMFVDEARITAVLHHPNIVQVYEFGEVGNLFYLTMEYLDGRNLGAMLDALHARGLLMPVSMSAHVAQQVARGLHYAHKLTDDAGVPLGVIHRDVSPSNVMLLRTGEVKILDFGVAKADSALKQGDTVVGKVKGKLSYMAPEQHSGKAIDQRADVFSLGVMLWEMLTGELLFGGAKGGERSRRMMRDEVPAPSTLRSKVPPELDAIVLRCLKLKPDDRYPSAGALAEELGAFVRTSLFDPAELAALVSDHPENETPEASAESSGTPVVVDSHAILTREDPLAQLDLDLMAAATRRERRRSFLNLRATPANQGAHPEADGDVAPAPPPSPTLAPPATARVRRFWPALVVLAAGVALALWFVPQRDATTVVTSSAAPRRAGAQITPVPDVERTPDPPAPADPPAPPRPSEPRSEVAPARPPVVKPAAPAKRRSRAAEPPPPAETQGVPPTVKHAPDGELRLVNPF